jgi:predicted GNAT family acetyltransferase
MFILKFRRAVLQMVSIAMFSAGFAQASFAGAIDTSYMVDADARSSSLGRIQMLLARDDVAEQLQQHGVDQALIEERLQGMTTAELATLEQRLDNGVAGGDVVGIIGATFLVLVILELVGVTDIFKAF